MRADPKQIPSILLNGSEEKLNCHESLKPGSLRSFKVVRLECLSPAPMERSDSLVGRKRVLPSFVGKTFYPVSPRPGEGGKRVLPSFIGRASQGSPSVSPTPSEEGRQLVDRMAMVLESLEGYVERCTAKWRRENADYCDGETPKTSQESNSSQKSDFNYSQRSVSEIASQEEVVEFVFGQEDHAFLREALQPFMGRDAPNFQEAATSLLLSDPKALIHVLALVLERARLKARKEQMEKERREAVRRRMQRAPSQEEEMDYIRREFPGLH